MQRRETKSIRIEEGRWWVAIFTGCQESYHKGGDISPISSYILASLDQTKLLSEDNQKKKKKDNYF